MRLTHLQLGQHPARVRGWPPPRKLYGLLRPGQLNALSWGCALILQLELGWGRGPLPTPPSLLVLITQAPPSGNRNPNES